MRLTGWLVLTYALIVFLGGIFGYVKAESTASLISGVVFAGILSTGAFALLNDKWIGMRLSLATTAILFAFFLYRFLLAFKWMPAGMMAILSLGMLIILFVKRSQLKAVKQ